MVIVKRVVMVRSLLMTRETQLAFTDWLKGNLTDQLRTRNSP